MNKLILSLFVVITVVGCASTSKQANNASLDLPIKTADAEFLEANGPLKLSFDEKGRWVTIETSATAPLSFDAAEGRELAFKIATMRAKRNLVEFLSNDLKSSKSLRTISKSYLKSIGQTDSNNTNGYAEDDGENDVSQNQQQTRELRQKANTIASTVRESIDDNAQFILKGVFISSRKVSRDGSHVSVSIRVSQQSMSTANSIRQQIMGI
jgi:hypothetical protein